MIRLRCDLQTELWSPGWAVISRLSCDLQTELWSPGPCDQAVLSRHWSYHACFCGINPCLTTQRQLSVWDPAHTHHMLHYNPSISFITSILKIFWIIHSIGSQVIVGFFRIYFSPTWRFGCDLSADRLCKMLWCIDFLTNVVTWNIDFLSVFHVVSFRDMYVLCVCVFWVNDYIRHFLSKRARFMI